MLRRGRPGRLGFTILEVMIFLAVSSMMFVAAIVVVGGKQSQVQFTQGVREVNSGIQDVINDVSTGFFPNYGSLSCDANPGIATEAPHFTATPQGQGTNDNCVFAGKALQFVPGQDFNVYTLASRRVSGGKEVTSYREALPTVVGDSPPPAWDITATKTLKWGIEVVKVVDVANPSLEFGSIVFMTSLPQYATLNALSSGNQNVLFAGVPTTALSDDFATGITKINRMTDVSVSPALALNPARGIAVCLRDSKGRTAVITVGGDNRSATTRLDIDQGVCPTP